MLTDKLATFVQSGEKVLPSFSSAPHQANTGGFLSKSARVVAKQGWKSVAIRTHAPDSDAHILHVGADGRDLALHLAGPPSDAAGGTHIAELAQLLHLHSGGLW